MSERVQDVQRVEDEVAEMVSTVPAELVAEFARIQLLIDSYGEDLATAPEATADPGAAAARFDDEGLESSLESVREWLADSCAEGADSV
ncbi:hypothetical protein [Kocuria sp. KH4]